MRPAADTGNAFAEYELSGEPGTEAFWSAARSPVAVPADDGGWRSLFLWRGHGPSPRIARRPRRRRWQRDRVQDRPGRG